MGADFQREVGPEEAPLLPSPTGQPLGAHSVWVLPAHW